MKGKKEKKKIPWGRERERVWTKGKAQAGLFAKQSC